MVIAKMDVVNSYCAMHSIGYLTFYGDCKRGLYMFSHGNVQFYNRIARKPSVQPI